MEATDQARRSSSLATARILRGILVYSLLLSACYLVRSPRAARIVESDPRMVSRCLYVGDLSGDSTVMALAQNEVLSKAAGLGATHVVWQALSGSGDSASAHGRVYRCHPRIAHIFYSYAGAVSAPGSPTRTRAAALAAAIRALERLKQGASFAKLAAAESDCPSRHRGGDLGFLGSGSLLPAFEKAAAVASDVAVGWMGVVESPYGFHVIVRSQ